MKRFLWAVVWFFPVVLLALVLLGWPGSARAQSTPPGLSGFTACVGDVVPYGPEGETALRCSLAGEPGVAFELWRYEGFSCTDTPEWSRAGVWDEGQPAELYVLRSCYDFASGTWNDAPSDGRGRAAYRRLFTEGPASPASAASAPATEAAVLRLSELVAVGLWVLAAGLGFFGYSVGARDA